MPRDLEEAALVDGAGRFRLLISITIPLVRRTIATNLMLITLQTLSVFGLIYTMTKGGPSEKSMTLPLFAYNVAFVSADLGYGTAIALLLLVIGGIFFGHLSPRPQQVGAGPVTAAVTAQASTAAPAVTRIRPRGRIRLSGRLMASLILLVLAAAFVIPLLGALAAVNGDPNQGISIVAAPVHARQLQGSDDAGDDVRAAAQRCHPVRRRTLITMVCATLAAYPLSRYRSRLKRPFLVTILFSTGPPITAIMVPVYGLFVQLALDDSIPATMVFMATTALPISIWLTKNFMDGVPIELEEAAWTDGASPMRGLLRIVMPLMGPGSVGGRDLYLHRTVGNLRACSSCS